MFAKTLNELFPETGQPWLTTLKSLKSGLGFQSMGWTGTVQKRVNHVTFCSQSTRREDFASESMFTHLKAVSPAAKALICFFEAHWLPVFPLSSQEVCIFDFPFCSHLLGQPLGSHLQPKGSQAAAKSRDYSKFFV